MFTPDRTVTADPLFAHAMDRPSNKEPFDLTRPLPETTLDTLAAAQTTRFGGTLTPEDVTAWRRFTRKALRIEIETPHIYIASVDLFRIGRAEVDANPHAIDCLGPFFELNRGGGGVSALEPGLAGLH